MRALARRIPEILTAGGFLLLPLAYSSWVSDNYVPAKWITLYWLVLLALASRLLQGLSYRLPPKRYLVAFAGMILIHVLSAAFHWESDSQVFLLDVICFGVVALTAFNAFSDDSVFSRLPSSLNAAALTALSVLLTIQFAAPSLLSFPMTPLPSGPFGFQNMTAEYLGLGVLLALALRTRILPVTLLAVVISSALLSRATWLALFAGFAVLFFTSKDRSMKKRVLLHAAVQILSIAIFWTTPGLTPGTKADLRDTKAFNVSTREARWKNTLRLIADHPWTGLGMGEFEFGYQPYAKAVLPDAEGTEAFAVKNPHNGYLELIAEMGIPLGVSLLLLLAWTALRLGRDFRARAERGPFGTAFGAVAAFVAVDAIFAFPMEQAVPWFFAAFCFGKALGEVYAADARELPLDAPALFAGAALLSLATALSFRVSFGKVAEAKFINDRAKVEMGCAMNPGNWRVCIQASRLRRASGDTDAAIEILDAMVERNPGNFVAIRDRAITYQRLGDQKRACEDIARYQTLFSHPPAFFTAVQHWCEPSTPGQ